jgi:D-alanine-D-alanine ligase
MARKAPDPSNCRTLGPVADLERHLPRDWWRSLFNALYLKTDGDVVENEKNTENEVDLLIQAAVLDPDDHLLDLCCGQGRHCLELARRGFRHLTGIDSSRYLIRLARRRARDAGVSLPFLEGDARTFRLGEGSMDCVAVLGNSFGYFDQQEDDLSVLMAIRRVLRSSGLLVLDVTDGDWIRAHFEPRSWEWIDKNHFVCRERSLSADARRLVCREIVTHAETGVIVDQFYAERLYSRDSIRELLEQAGFAGVHDHCDVQVESTRNQDLGMMAHRMFLTARAPDKMVSVMSNGMPLYRDVTVLLGDPSLPDRTKRDGCFNDEDALAVSRLKDALAALTEYRFQYVDRHASLLTELRRNRPAFVLNFCAEGYRNEAVRALHIPAYLEMLDVPYSGSGPACVAACYDKSLVRAVAASLRIPILRETYLRADDPPATLPAAFPLLVKPNRADGSIGITANLVAHTMTELLGSLERLRDEFPNEAMLIHEFLDGPEYSVGVLGNVGQGLEILPRVVIDNDDLDPGLSRIRAYESKVIPATDDYEVLKAKDAALDERTRRTLADYSTQLFERLGCRDYARFDFRLDRNGEIKLLEANPNPEWCWNSKLAVMAQLTGMSYTEFLLRLLRVSQQRVAAEPHRQHTRGATQTRRAGRAVSAGLG